MRGLLRNNRFYTLALSAIIALSFYIYLVLTIRSEQLQIIRLTQSYALLAVFYLYIALLVGPLSRFINGHFIQKWLHARRAIGVSSFLFAFLHANFAFFGQLGGFSGIPFLSDYYLLGISYSFIALIILLVMALTSFDAIVAKLKFRRWKMIHRLVYIAGIFILIHALMLGTHFHDLSELIPTILFTAVTFLLLLYALCLEKKYANFFSAFRFSVLSILVLFGMSWFYFSYMNPINDEEQSSFSVHSQHTSASNNGTSQGTQNLYMPGMEGDRSKRYNVQFLHDEIVSINKESALQFKITDAVNGEPIYYFQTPFEKPFHLIIVNSDLNYFAHIHPTQQQNAFLINHLFPAEGNYRLYADFQPFGAIEQQYGFQLNVGSKLSTSIEINPDYKLEKVVDNYRVNFSYEKPLKSKALTAGTQKFTFTIYDSNGNPITNLQPYLGAFGHLVMIRKDSYDYVHVHPIIAKRVLPTDVSGPTVEFAPMSIYGEVKPGVYKVFGQFNPEGKLITVDFWIEVE